MTHFCCAAVLPSLCSEQGGDPAGCLSSTPRGPEPCCSGQGSPPSLRGTRLGFCTTLLKSILQQPELRGCKQSREPRGSSNRKAHATTQERHFSVFSSLAYRKGTSVSPVFNHSDSSSTFHGHTNRCVAGSCKRGHVPGLNTCTGARRSSTYAVLRSPPAIQETAQVTGAAFLLGLVQTQCTAYQPSLGSCADVKQFSPISYRSRSQ